MRIHLLTVVFCTVAPFAGPQLPASPPQEAGEIKKSHFAVLIASIVGLLSMTTTEAAHD